MASKTIYQMYAELEDYEPKIWRRFQVTNDITFAKLAYILMTLFEMKGSHLYNFEFDELKNYKINHLEHYNEYFKGKEDGFFKISQFSCDIGDDFNLPEEDENYRKMIDASKVKLNKVINEEKQEMKFVYDFGDNWTLKIVLEEIFKDETLNGKDLPRVIEGQGFGIVEDCGGVFGLEEIRKAIKSKKGENYEMYSEWLGIDDLDLEKCDLDDLNFRLKKLPRIFKNIYEDGTEPSENAMKLLDRE